MNRAFTIYLPSTAVGTADQSEVASVFFLFFDKTGLQKKKKTRREFRMWTPFPRAIRIIAVRNSGIPFAARR